MSGINIRKVHVYMQIHVYKIQSLVNYVFVSYFMESLYECHFNLNNIIPLMHFS